MPDEAQRLAKILLDEIRDELKECNTAECQRARAEGEAAYKRIVDEADMKSLKKLEELDKDIVRLLEGLEKQMNTPIEIPPCPHCGYDSDEKPKVAGRCPGGHCTVDEYDREIGVKNCPACGEEIEWD